MQYLIPRSRKFCSISNIFSFVYMGLRPYFGLVGLVEIGMIERGRCNQAPLDLRAQVFHHPREPEPTLVRARPARRSRYAVAAGAIDGMREHQPGRAIRIIGGGDKRLADEF